MRITAALSLIALALLGWVFRFHVWPRYHEHSASWWLDQVNLESFDTNAKASVEAFRIMGPSAVRFLGDELELGFRLEHVVPNDWLQRPAAAYWILSQLGTNIMPAMPSVLRIFRASQDGDKYAIAEVIAQLPPKNIEFLMPELISSLKSDPLTNYWAAWPEVLLMERLGPSAKPAIPVLRTVLNSHSPNLMSKVAVALWHIGHDTNALMECMQYNLKSRSGRTDGKLLRELQGSTNLPPSFLSLAERALYHPLPRVRSIAETFFEKTDSGRLPQIKENLNLRQEELLKAHLDLLKSTNEVDRVNALNALPFFGAKASVAVPQMLDILLKPRPRTLPPVPVLDEPTVAEEYNAILSTFKTLGPHAAPAVPTLVHLLHDRQNGWRACDALAAIGPSASAALPTLRAMFATNDALIPEFAGRRMFRAPNSIQQWELAQAIVSIDSQDTNAVAILREANQTGLRHANGGVHFVRSVDPNINLTVKVTLWKQGLDTNLPLDDLATNEAALAPQLLGSLGPAARRVLPILKAQLTNSNPKIDRRGVALAICKIDPDEAKRIGLPGLYILCPDKY